MNLLVIFISVKVLSLKFLDYLLLAPRAIILGVLGLLLLNLLTVIHDILLL
jgi:hypothetical protein